MGWDIVFYARFREREDPAARFRQVMSELGHRDGFEPLSSFAVLDDGDPLRMRVDLNDIFQGAEPVTAEQVETCLRELSGDRVGFRGVWRIRCGSVSGGVWVTTFGAKVALPNAPPPPIDLAWDIGDWRRYPPGGKEGKLSIDAVMNDVAVLVELGAESIWGVDADKIISPEHLYAVFHRDPDQYRHDGGPPFPPITIDEDCVRAALEVSSDLRAVETPSGPIIYHKELGYGNLRYFYYALLGAVEFLFEEQK
jgi:hypothetical protein